MVLVSDEDWDDMPTGPGFRFEGGGVLGEDGNGWMAGTGLVVGNSMLNIGLVYRYTNTDQGDRHDLAFDFQIALPVPMMMD